MKNLSWPNALCSVQYCQCQGRFKLISMYYCSGATAFHNIHSWFPVLIVIHFDGFNENERFVVTICPTNIRRISQRVSILKLEREQASMLKWSWSCQISCQSFYPSSPSFLGPASMKSASGTSSSFRFFSSSLHNGLSAIRLALAMFSAGSAAAFRSSSAALRSVQ